MQSVGFLGFDKFVWFEGVVEDRLDPMKLGRVRVRVFGIHTEDKSILPTEELPWAYVINSIGASVNGIGETPVGLVEGTWVIGFFRDGANCQEPLVFGTFASVPWEYPWPTSKKIGFRDGRTELEPRPRKIEERKYSDGYGVELKDENVTVDNELYPRKKHPLGSVVNESDINRLARNEIINDTIVAVKKTNRDLAVPIAEGGTWDEPSTPYDSSYPYNKVFESESGHIIEVDDTRGGERLHIWHRSGTFVEIYPDGIKVEKTVGNNYSITMEEKYEHVQNRYNLTVSGPFNIYAENNCNVVICGNANITVGGDMTTKVRGNYVVEAAGSVSITGYNTTIGSKYATNLKGATVNSYPPISQSLETMKASGLGIVVPRPAQPQAVPNISGLAVVTRTYPRPIPNYVTVKENL